MTGISNKLKTFFVYWWLPCLVVLAWWLISENFSSFFFPPLSKILSALYRDLSSGLLIGHLAVSLGNMALGLIYAIVLGITFGLFIGAFKLLRQATEPLLNFLRSVPPAAIVPLVIIAMGIGSTPKIFIIALACFWPVLLNTIDGVRGIPPQMMETTRAFRIPMRLLFWRVLLMAALPQIMAGIRIAIAVALVLMVISEFFGASSGIGFYINEAKQRFAMVETWAGTLVIGILGYVLSSAFLKFEHWMLAWYFQETSSKKSKKPADQA
jgi:ABC-type nitrate/sulfonate/bicarbonate transport system permease component